MSMRICFEQTRHIQNECDTTIAGDGGPGHAWGSLQQVVQRLDHHFFLANQIIHDKAYLLSANLHYDHMARILP